MVVTLLLILVLGVVVIDVLLVSLVLHRVMLLVANRLLLPSLVSVDILRRVQNKDAATHHVVRWSRLLWSRMFCWAHWCC